MVQQIHKDIQVKISYGVKGDGGGHKETLPSSHFENVFIFIEILNYSPSSFSAKEDSQRKTPQRK